MTFTSWLAVVSICLLGAMSPGPSLAVVMRQTLSGGRKAGFITAFAHGLGFGLYALACVSGIAVVITTSPLLFTGLQWLGAGFLIWLGIKGLLAKPAAPAATADLIDAVEPGAVAAPSASMSNTRSALRDGFLVVFLNPKIAVFLIAVFSQVIGDHTTGIERLVYVATALFIDMGWYTVVAWLFSNPLWLGGLQRNAVWLERIFGVILIALAARLLIGF